MARRGRDRLGLVQRGDLQLRRAARRASRPRPPLPHGERHRGHRPRVGGVGSGGVRAVQRSVGDRDLGAAVGAAHPQPRPAGRPSALRRPHAVGRAVRLRGQGAVRRRRRRSVARPGRARRGLHVLEHGGAPRRSSPASARFRRATTSSSMPTASTPRRTGSMRFPSGWRRARPGPRRERRAAPRARRDCGPAAVRALRRPGRVRTCRAVWTRRSRRRSSRGYIARRCRRSRCASPTPTSTKASTSTSWPADSGTEHHEVVVDSADIADVFPEVVYHAESPLLRSAPAPLYLLSRLVADAGYKVVVTGEGADEVLAGYDIFREGRLREFWLRNPASTVRDHGGVAAVPVARAVAGRGARPSPGVLRQGPRPGRPRAVAPATLELDVGAEAHADARRCGRPAPTRSVSCSPACRPTPARWDPLDPRPVAGVDHASAGLHPGVPGRPHAHGQLGRGALPVPRPRRGRVRDGAPGAAQAARPRREARPQAGVRGRRARRRSSSGPSSRTEPRTRRRSSPAATVPDWLGETSSPERGARRRRLRAAHGRRARRQVPADRRGCG